MKTCTRGSHNGHFKRRFFCDRLSPAWDKRDRAGVRFQEGHVCSQPQKRPGPGCSPTTGFGDRDMRCLSKYTVRTCPLRDFLYNIFGANFNRCFWASRALGAHIAAASMAASSKAFFSGQPQSPHQQAAIVRFHRPADSQSESASRKACTS